MIDKTFKNNKLEFFYNKEQYKIKRTKHLYDKRASGHQRDAFIDDTRFIKIFKEAITYGLTSFRGKGAVLVNVPIFNGKYFSVLCELDYENTITVITVLYTRWFWKSFTKVQNRINMVYKHNAEVYRVPKMSEKEKMVKRLDSICHEVKQTDEDLTFNNAMSNIIDIRKVNN